MSVEVCADETSGTDGDELNRSDCQNRETPLAYEELWRPTERQLEYFFDDDGEYDHGVTFAFPQST